MPHNIKRKNIHKNNATKYPTVIPAKTPNNLWAVEGKKREEHRKMREEKGGKGYKKRKRGGGGREEREKYRMIV